MMITDSGETFLYSSIIELEWIFERLKKKFMFPKR